MAPKVLRRREMLGLLAAAGLVGCGASSDVRSDGAVTGDLGPDPDAAAGDVGGRPDGALRADLGSTADGGLDAALPQVCDPTDGDATGPFYEAGAPDRMNLAPNEAGERLRINGVVRGPDCAPLPNALLDVWQADAQGTYHDAAPDWRLRGRLRADAQGRYSFDTIRPGRYALGDSLRPAHIHFRVSHPGFTRVTTQLYFEDDPFLAPNDPCTADCDSSDPDRIVALTLAEGVLVGEFDVTLGA